MATRSEMYARMGILKPIADPILDVAYKIEEEQIWREDLLSSPHGEHWHTSFHASSFPGDNPKACGRKAIYTLMNIPAFDPVDRSGRAVMEAGKDIEKQIVWRFYRGGICLTGSPKEEHQVGFEDREHWLTGSPDLIITTPQLNRPHPIEIKTKDHDAVMKMQAGQRSFDMDHRNQILTYIGFTKEMSEQLSRDSNGINLWPVDMTDECKDGTLLYVSRDRPGTTHEYRFQYNAEFMEKGRIKLKDWQEHFLSERLPERPKDWKWTEPPCKWCPVKKICKADYKEEVTKLSESNAIAHAKSVRGKYDYEQTRQAVLDRWKGGENNE